MDSDATDPDDPGFDPDDFGPDDGTFRPPLPPEDRLWRHPSEVAAEARALHGPPGPGVATTARGGRRPRRPASGRTVFITAIAIAAVFGAGVSLVAVAATGGWDTRVVERRVSVANAATASTAADDPAEGVVGLRIRRDDEWRSANAVVYRSDGFAITTLSAIDGADDIRCHRIVATPVAAEIVGIDPVTGIAVVKLDGDDFTPAVLGTAASLAAGDAVTSISSSDADAWQPTVDSAMVSATGQRLAYGEGAMHDLMTLTDIAERPVPGSPVVDATGAVVGLVAGVTSDEQVSPAAITIDVAARIAEELIDHGRVEHVWLGIAGTDLNPEDAAELGVAGGASVTAVVASSPAEDVGLQTGDAITAVDDTTVTSMSDLVTSLWDHSPGDVVTLTVRRDGDTVTTPVELAAR